MKPAFVVGGLYHRANGVAWIMRDTACALSRQGSDVTVYAADCPRPSLSSIGNIFESPTRWVAEPGRWLGGLSWSPRLHSRMKRDLSQHDVIHNHSVWMLPNHYAALVAKQKKIPITYTMHGTFEPWALKNSGWKKSIVGHWFQYRDIKAADCLHVNSQRELKNSRLAGLKNPIAIIPNGINYQPSLPRSSHNKWLESFPHLKDHRCFLFMARIHKKKGIDHLISAWGSLQKDFPDWHFVIAGPDDGYLAACQAQVESLGLTKRVTFTGNLQGESKRDAMRHCEFLVQPSHSEGFSMSVIEAMGARLPVLISQGCNFPEAAQHGAGLEIESTVEQTEQGLKSLLEMSDAQRQDMGLKGEALVIRDYTWDRVAKMMLELYEWMVNGSPQPSFLDCNR